jgi:biopolymer transport protein ExbB/TolQ
MLELLQSVLPELNFENVLTGVGGVGSVALGLYLKSLWDDYQFRKEQERIEKLKEHAAEKEKEAAEHEAKAEVLEKVAGDSISKANDSDQKADTLLVEADRIAQEIEANKRAERELLAKGEVIRSTIEGLTPEKVDDEFTRRGF